MAASGVNLPQKSRPIKTRFGNRLENAPMVRALVVMLSIAIFPTLYLLLVAGRQDSISYFAGLVAGVGLMAALHCAERFRRQERGGLERQQA
jgi:hypothetical protein